MPTQTMTAQQLLRQHMPAPHENGNGSSGPSESPDPANVQRRVYAVRLQRSIHALNRVLNLFSARNYTLDSCAFGADDDTSTWRLTLVSTDAPRKLTQLERRLRKLVDVLEIEVLPAEDTLERELCLLVVGCEEERRREMFDCLDVFDCTVLEMTPTSAVIQLVASARRVESFIQLMRPFGLHSIARSGSVGLSPASTPGHPSSGQ